MCKTNLNIILKYPSPFLKIMFCRERDYFPLYIRPVLDSGFIKNVKYSKSWTVKDRFHHQHHSLDSSECVLALLRSFFHSSLFPPYLLQFHSPTLSLSWSTSSNHLIYGLLNPLFASGLRVFFLTSTLILVSMIYLFLIYFTTSVLLYILHI